MRKFDYSFLKLGMVPAELIDVTNGINSFRIASNERKERFKEIFTELEKVARIQSIKSSNAIEGIVTTDQRIRDIVNGNSAPLNHNEAEIAGYRDCLNKIHTSHNSMQVNEETILSLHKQLMSVANYDFVGQYKDTDNVIMEIDAYGNRRVRFRPIPASETKQAMEQLVLAYMDAYNQGVNSLLLIPCFILDFLCVHPFRDGNGRMSRLLTLLLLYKAGFDAGKYISYEEQINKDKAYYYEALRRSSEKWDTNENDYFPFISNSLFTLFNCYKELDKRFAVVNSKKITKKGRIEATIMNSITPLTKEQICLILPDVSRTTVEAVLSQLMKDGKIVKHGNTRNAMYTHK